MRQRCGWVLILGILFLPALAPASSLNPPDDNAAVAPLIDSIQTELSQGHAADAAAHLDALLRDHAADLITLESGWLVSVSVRADELLAANRAALAAQYTAQFDAAAGQMLRGVTPASDPIAFYAVAQRYPLTATASAALYAAGDRAAALGDLSCGLEYYRLAQLAGAAPDSSQQQRLQAMTKALNPPAPAATTFHGPIAFESGWYRGSYTPQKLIFPYFSGGIAFFATPAHVLAVKETGEMLWTQSIDPAPAPQQSQQQAQPQFPQNRQMQMRFGRQALPPAPDPNKIQIAPAILSAAGAARIVVARCGLPGSDTDAGLTALSASDGHVLWSTFDTDSLARLWFNAAPLLEGRYVYALATDQGAQSCSVILLALDASTGREIWRTTLGAVAPSVQFMFGRRGRGGGQSVYSGAAEFSESAGLAIAGDQLILTPNAGYVIAVGRLDGRLRWMHQYPAQTDLVQNNYSAPSQSPRYDNRPCVAGDRVIVAAQDGPVSAIYNLTTGEKIWQSVELGHSTLVGAAGNAAIFAGPLLQAVNMQNGKTLWEHSSGKGVIDGPPVMVDGVIYAPTPLGMAVIDAQSGAAAKNPLAAPTVQSLLKSTALRSQLGADGVLTSVISPTVSRSAGDDQP